MRILDVNGEEIFQPDLDKGQLIEEKLFIKHHPAVEAVEEQFHYEDVCKYANGGKDVKKVIDVEGVDACDAWDEYEDILRYTPYTPEELEEFKRPSELSQLKSENESLKVQIKALSNQLSLSESLMTQLAKQVYSRK